MAWAAAGGQEGQAVSDNQPGQHLYLGGFLSDKWKGQKGLQLPWKRKGPVLGRSSRPGRVTDFSEGLYVNF